MIHGKSHVDTHEMMTPEKPGQPPCSLTEGVRAVGIGPGNLWEAQHYVDVARGS